MVDFRDVAISVETKNSLNSSVQIQIQPKSQLECVPRDTEESEILDMVDFRDVVISVETVTHMYTHTHTITYTYTHTHVHTHILAYQLCRENMCKPQKAKKNLIHTLFQKRLDMTFPTQNTTTPKSTKLRNKDSAVSRGRNSN